MSQAVLNFYYGIDLDVDSIYDDEVDTDNLYGELSNCGAITRLYDAYGERPCKLLLGVKVVEYHEHNGINISRLVDSLTKDQQQLKEEFDTLWNDLDEELRQVIEKHFGNSPELFNIWSNT